MPYEIKKSEDCPADKPWGVFKRATGENLGCHPSQESAQKQMDALHANEPKRSQIALPWEWRTHFETLEVRDAESGSGKTAVGYAFRYGKLSENLGGFVERVAPGAASKTIQEQDIRGLFNHDPNFLIGRKGAGTLRFEDTNAGLRYFNDLPDTSLGRDLAVLLERRDIFGSSFSFKTVGRDGASWSKTEQGYPLRTVNLMMMRDVGPVTFPAYSSSEVVVRSLATVEFEKPKDILALIEERNIPFEEVIAAVADGRLAELLNPEEIRERATHRIRRIY